MQPAGAARRNGDQQSLLAGIAARADDLSQNVVRQFHALGPDPVLNAQQPPADQRVDQRLRHARLLQRRLQRQVVPKARLRQQLVLHKPAHAFRQIGDTPFVEISENLATIAGHEVRRDLRKTARLAPLVQFAADDRKEGRFNIQLGEPLGGAATGSSDELDNHLGDLSAHDARPRLNHGLERLHAGHSCEPHPVIHQRRHRGFQTFQMRQIVFAQRDDHAIVGAREVKRLHLRAGFLQSGDELFRRPIFDELRQLAHEADGARALATATGPEREKLLKLIKYQDRHNRATGGSDESIITMVKEFPQGFGGLRAARLGPRPRSRSVGLYE